jgi:hypothetical protein
LDDDEFKIVYKVLKKHPEAEKKIGVGVDSILCSGDELPR